MARLDDSEIAKVRAWLDQLARRRWPTLQTRHAELVSDAVGSLLLWAHSKDREIPISELRMVGAAILRNHASDFVRKQVREFAAADVIEEVAEDVSAEARMDARLALRAALHEIASMSLEDRHLLVNAATGGGDGPLNDRDRKRLERLREQLSVRLKRRRV